MVKKILNLGKNAARQLREKYKIMTSEFTKDTNLGTKFSIGDFTYGYPKVYTHDAAKEKLTIGKFCSISDNVSIFLCADHRTDWISTFPFPYNSHFKKASLNVGHPASKGDIKIGNDVWIGAGATILSGVTIGDGAVIGARAVVAKNVRSYAIIVGNPANEIKRRFDDRTINDLLAIQWWHWPIEKIQENAHLLASNNLNEFITLHVKTSNPEK